jgi:hypothetical protein
LQRPAIRWWQQSQTGGTYARDNGENIRTNGMDKIALKY